MSEQSAKVGDIFEQRYELLEVLGSGGIGTVFKARQLDSERLIALKILHANIAFDDEFQIRFVREGQALSKLHHENIVTVYHLGVSESGVPYLAMELIKGISLRKVLAEKGPLTLARTVAVTQQLCSALSLIHSSGIVHRDLKPDNIVFVEEAETDQIKIIDFGLARFEQETDAQKLTSTGALIGSVVYMSPEQCKGLKADARSDLYSLVVCIYEMLAGTPPFVSDNPMEMMYKHVHAPAPQLSNLGTSRSFRILKELIQKGLKKEPEARFQTAGEIENAISALADFDDSHGKASASEIRLPKKIAILGTLLVMLIAASCFVYEKLSVKEKYSRTDSVPVKSPNVVRNAAAAETRNGIMQLLSRKDKSAVYKIQALINFLKKHGMNGNEDLAETARKLCDELPPGRRATLYPRVLYTEGELYLELANPNMAASMFEEFCKIVEARSTDENRDTSDFGVESDAYWVSLGYLARCYANSGRKEAALKLSYRIAKRPVGGDSEALQTALELHDEKLARLLIDNQQSAAHLTTLSRISRTYKRFDLSKICLERVGSSEMTATKIYGFLIEKAKFLFQTGQLNEARVIIQDLAADSELDDFFADGKKSHARYDVALLMELLGLHKDAVKVAMLSKRADENLHLLKAYLLVEDRRYEDARAILKAAPETMDPYPEKRQAALKQLDLIESGKTGKQAKLFDIHELRL